MKRTATGALARQLADRTGTNPGDWYFVFRTRYGMLQVFSALASQRPDASVVTQLLTCATAVDPIVVAGLKPVYAEISAETLSIDPAALSVNASDAAVVIQHTFGMIDDDAAGRVAAAAASRSILVCEDSAHCVGRMAMRKDGTPLADVSFHSFGVEKMLPTKFGGAVWVNPAMADRGLHDEIVGRLAALRAPSARLRAAARTYRVQRGLLNRLPSPVSRMVRPMLTTMGLFAPTIAPIETAGGLAHRAAGMSSRMAREVSEHVRRLASTEEQRARVTAAYATALGGAAELPAGATQGQPLVRFPFLVPVGVDADEVTRRLNSQGIVAGSWYRPVLFPGVGEPAVYGYDPDDAAVPVTDDVVARIVNLPTGVSLERADQIAKAALTAIDSCRSSRT